MVPTQFPIAAEITGTSAWIGNKNEIDSFVSSGLDGTTHAAYIVSPHASGKSTTMLAFICSRVLAQTPDARLLYLVSTPTEATILGTYLKSEDFKSTRDSQDRDFEGVSSLNLSAQPNPGSLCLLPFAEFCQTFNARERPTSRTIILLDAEINPTTEGELAFGIVMHWAFCCRRHEDKDGHAIAVLSQFFSKRTNDAIIKHVKQVRLITVEDRHKELRIEVIKDDWATHTRELITRFSGIKNSARNRVLVSDPNPWETGLEPDKLLPVHINNIDTLPTVLAHCDAIAIPPWIGFSTAYGGLRYLISIGTVNTRFFDRRTSQIVNSDRSLNQLEVNRDYSWALKSSLSLQNVVIYTAYPKEKTFAIGNEFAGDAYNGDLLITVLRLIQQWPDMLVREMPIRAIDDILAVKEIYNRLTIVGCIQMTENGSGKYRITDRGRCVLSLQQVFDGGIINFHVAYFLSCIKQHPLEFSDNLKRVMIRIAAIVMEDIGTFCAKEYDSPMPTVEKIQEHCLGSGTSRVHRGAVWTALAMYQKMYVSSHAAQAGISSLQQQDWLVLSPSSATAIARRVESLEAFFGVQDHSSQEEERTKLSEDEMDRIEVELMWAWLNQVVCFDKTESKTYDLLSLKEVHLDRSEMLNVQNLHRQYRTKGCFGIYFSLNLEDEDYIVSQVTVIPRRCFHEVEKRTGLEFPEFISTTYPVYDIL